MRLILTPIIVDFLTRGKTPEEALAEILQWQTSNDDRVMVGNHFKLMIDGAIFSGLAQMGPPGYLDGHEGVWMVPERVLRAYGGILARGISAPRPRQRRCGRGSVLEADRGLQRDFPRPDHRSTIEHLAYSTEQQSAQLAKLGAQASVNPYYHYIFPRPTLGLARATPRGTMNRLGSPSATTCR